MSDPLLRELDHYVVLEPAGAETILTAAETLQWLISKLEGLASLPADLQAGDQCGPRPPPARDRL